MSLLTDVVFRATQGSSPYKYLGIVNDGFLDYSTTAVLSNNAKFKIENAKNGLVHIRSYFTNKYWVRSSTSGNWIVAQGVEPEDDQTSWTCTLFRIDIDDAKKVKFYHVQSGNIVRIANDNTNRKMCLTISTASPSQMAVSIAIDYDTFVVLPKYVAFKGSNNKYYQNFCTSGPGNDGWAHFSVTNIGDPNIVCETEYTDDGLLRVKTKTFTPDYMFWNNYASEKENLIEESGGWSQPYPSRMLFSVIKVDRNVVALRSLLNNKICQRADVVRSGSKKDRMVAKANGVIPDACLEVVEPVFRRSIYSVEFDLDNARTYGLQLLYTDEHVWKNPTDQTQNGSADGKITSSKSKSYTNKISVSGTVTTTIETGVPFIAKGKIELSVTAEYSHEWSKVETEEQQVGHVFSVVVLPRKKTVARGTATKASCDVPFSYVQKDYPANGGPPITTRLSDGVFKGANAYGFESEVWYEELSPQDLNSNHKQVQFYKVPAKAPTPVTKKTIPRANIK